MSQILKPAIPKNEISFVPLPVGFTSPDGGVVLGRDGYLFLVSGTNNLEQQYATDHNHPQVIKDAEAWVRLVENRISTINEHGSKFIQLLIPEKTSVLQDFVPLTFNAPTGRYQHLTSRVKSSDIAMQHVIDCYDLFLTSSVRKESYRKLDSHFSAQGAALVMAAILKKLGSDVEVPHLFSDKSFQAADLGRQLIAGIDKEETDTLCHDEIAKLSAGLEVVEQLNPPDGKNIGTRIIFRRPEAPINMRVVAFANSFFERGGSTSGLTWWFARMFTEFHFVWNPDLDLSYVEATKPDLVIAQTIERFLPRIPQS